MTARTETVSFGDISAVCEFTPKKVKNINIRVRQDGRVCVSYPVWVSLFEARAVLLQRSDFVRNALLRLGQSSPAPVSEKLFYHGRELTLDPYRSERPVFSLSGDRLGLGLPEFGSAAAVKCAAESWLSGQCRLELTGLCLELYPLFNGVFPFPELRFKKMTSRWGSCMPSKNTVTLNTALISVPTECAEYVIVHEFCHFLHPNHSKSFHAEVEKYLPDWRERRKKLNGYAIR